MTEQENQSSHTSLQCTNKCLFTLSLTHPLQFIYSECNTYKSDNSMTIAPRNTFYLEIKKKNVFTCSTKHGTLALSSSKETCNTTGNGTNNDRPKCAKYIPNFQCVHSSSNDWTKYQSSHIILQCTNTCLYTLSLTHPLQYIHTVNATPIKATITWH